MKNWTKSDQPSIRKVNSLQADLKIPNFICSLLIQRDINSIDKAKNFFRPKLDSLHDPYLMKDMEKAVDRVNKGKKEKQIDVQAKKAWKITMVRTFITRID